MWLCFFPRVAQDQIVRGKVLITAFSSGKAATEGVDGNLVTRLPIIAPSGKKATKEMIYLRFSNSIVSHHNLGQESHDGGLGSAGSNMPQ